MELDIKYKVNGFECIFYIGKQEYLASLVMDKDDFYADPECMIFKSKDRQFSFTDANGVYENHNVKWSEDGLRRCIEDFIQLQQ